MLIKTVLWKGNCAASLHFDTDWCADQLVVMKICGNLYHMNCKVWTYDSVDISKGALIHVVRDASGNVGQKRKKGFRDCHWKNDCLKKKRFKTNFLARTYITSM